MVNTNGGKTPMSESMTIVKQRFCLEEELDWTGTYLDRPGEDAGWLDRDGNFFGCRAQDHATYAMLILNTTMKNLEDHGWVHIYGGPGSQDHKPYGDFVCLGDDGMSDEQIKYLRSVGHKVSPIEERRKAKLFDNKTDWELKEPTTGGLTAMKAETKPNTHEWVCDGCGEFVPFRQPELPQTSVDSEANESKICPGCGDSMYFDVAEYFT